MKLAVYEMEKTSLLLPDDFSKKNVPDNLVQLAARVLRFKIRSICYTIKISFF